MLKRPRIAKKRDEAVESVGTFRRAGTAVLGAAGLCAAAGLVYIVGFAGFSSSYEAASPNIPDAPVWPLPLDKKAYNDKMLALAHYVPPVLSTTTATSTSATSTPSVVLPVSTATTSVSVAKQLWPTPTVYPHGGAILPFSRVVAYYGNLYSRFMGILGEYPEDEMLAKLASTTAMWRAADPSTPVVPAIHYIAVVAQGSAGPLGLWRAQMPDKEIDKALAMAEKIEGLLFLDIQVGKSTLQAELPAFEKYLSLPNVHLGIDPEFSMKYGDAPGHAIGTFDAADINYAVTYLANLVREHHLPPKILVIHRFTQEMVTNYQNIKPLPEVQVVMHMDGWGPKEKKFGTYNHVVAPEPVQFTGIKIFYKNDLKSPSTGLLTPQEVLSLTPAPIYIQYQ